MRVIPHISVYLIQDRGALRGHGGVESPRSILSHYQTMPHHHCHHMAIAFGVPTLEGRHFLGGEKKRLNPGVSTSQTRNSCNVAVEQYRGKERQEAEGGFKKNGERCYVWLTIIGHSAVWSLTNKDSPVAPSTVLYQELIVNLKHQGHTADWWRFPWTGSMTLTVCQSLPAKVLLPQQITSVRI